MADFQIFSDGACDLGLKMSKDLDITLIPFYVSLDHEKYYKEIFELSLDEYYHDMVENNGYPKTSLPSVQDYIDAFRPVLEQGKDVFCLTITHALSSSIQSAQTAKMMLDEEFPERTICVIDSWNITGSQALLLMECSRMKRDGKTLDEIASYVEKAKNDTRIHFMVGDLSHLQVGGRIGKLATLSGSILKIKPVIVFKSGDISFGGAVRSRKKGMARIADLTRNYFKESGEDPSHYIALVGTTNTWEEIPEFRALMEPTMPGADWRESFQIGATVATHTGPGTLGTCFVKKYEYYE